MPVFNGLDEYNCKTRRETFKFWYLVWQTEGLDVLYAPARVHCENKTWQIGFNHNHNNDANRYLTMPIIKGRCGHDPLPHIFQIGGYECSKNNSTTIEHNYNEFANLICELDQQL